MSLMLILKQKTTRLKRKTVQGWVLAVLVILLLLFLQLGGLRWAISIWHYVLFSQHRCRMQNDTSDKCWNITVYNQGHLLYGCTDFTQKVLEDFNKNGFVIVRGLLDNEELTRIKTSLDEDGDIVKNRLHRDDGQGRKACLTLWNHPGNDISGMVARSEKVVGTMESLLGGEVYHYHTKLIQKEAFTGGSFSWHQDYGYWYENGCLWPDMGTVYIAIDKADRHNGCLKVLPGSHRLGRIDHIRVGDQIGADPKRIKELLKVMTLTYLELDAGDAAFFHCNLLHCSDQNNSEHRRWAFLCSYNRASNNPIMQHHHPQYTPLIKVPDSAIKTCLHVGVQDRGYWSGQRKTEKAHFNTQ